MLMCIEQCEFSSGGIEPGSDVYERILYRPSISLKNILYAFIIPLAIMGSIVMFVVNFCDVIWGIVLSALVFAFTVLIFGKRTVIVSVMLYQKFAPDKIRKKCRFEPSCSNYMIISVQKYGLVMGVLKGIRRLRKCNNRGKGFSGIDYP